MSEFFGKLLLGFFTGLVFPILLEMWKANRLRSKASGSQPIDFSEIADSGWTLIKAIFRVIGSGFAGLGAASLINEHILHQRGMPESFSGYVMVVVFSIVSWRFLSNR